MQCKRVSINIVTLLLACHDCQNGTLDSINSVHPPLPTHVQAHTYMYRYTYMHIHSGIHTRARAHTHTHTHTHTHAHKTNTQSQSPFNVYPHGDTV